MRGYEMFCENCGTRYEKDAVFCYNCGKKKEDKTSKKDTPQNLIGFSEMYRDPSIIAAAKKNKKASIGCMWVLVFVPLIGFFIAGLLIDEFDMNEALIIGGVISFAMLLINLIGFARSKKPMWEGQVVDKSVKKKQKRSNSDNEYETYTAYTTIIRTSTGKNKKITEIDSQRDMFDYLQVGDRVRYQPVFDTFEKYDKSKDKIIYCNVCKMMNAINNIKCKRCDNFLFK